MKAGDLVQWTETGSARRTISMRKKSGVIHFVVGETALVVTDKGTEYEVPVSKLKSINEKSDLTTFVELLRSAKYVD